MDWIIPLITACAGISGAAVAGHFALKSQSIAQRNENVRHARKVAYETAVREWELARALYLRGREVGHSGPEAEDLPSLDDFIIHHLTLTDALTSVDLNQVGTNDIAAIISRLWTREEQLLAVRKKQQQA